MKGQAALLLVCLGCALQVNAIAQPPLSVLKEKSSTSTSLPLNSIDPIHNIADPRDILIQKIKDLNKEVENEKMQEEIGKTLKAEAEKSKTTPSTGDLMSLLNKSDDTIDMNKLLEDDATLKNDNAEDVSDDYDDDEDEDDDDADDDDGFDDDDDDDSEDEEDEEKAIANCPRTCKCVRYPSVTAKCETLDDTQMFSRGILHLEVNGNGVHSQKLNLGPKALRAFGLQQLESIKFVDVTFNEFDRSLFSDLPALYSINMTRTSLKVLDPDLFQNCSQLNMLAISGHNFMYGFKEKNKAKEYLLDVRSLNEFEFSNNSLTSLPRLAFAKMPELIYINLTNNMLYNLDRVTFKTLQSLGELDVSGNRLSYFSPKFFDGLEELRILRIADNRFTSLRSIISDHLTELDASGNMIKHITKDDLAGILSIDQLTLKSNGITRINPHAFTSLDQLTFLDISDNSITSITENHFKSNPRLQILLMSNNPNLQSLPIFRTNTEEHGTFSIYRFECSNCGLKFLEEKTFDAMPALNRLDLSKNALTTLPKNLFSRLQSLRELNLADNFLSKLETNMFFGAVSLTKLNLSGNFLKSLQVTPFIMTPSLFRLDVSRNNLERVWSEAREPLKSLRFLSVRSNMLKRFTVEELKATPSLSALIMNDNPLVCDEDFKDAIEYLTKYGIIPKQSVISSEDLSFPHESITQWSDLAKNVCQFLYEGPPSRTPDKFPIVIHNVIEASSAASPRNNPVDINDKNLSVDDDSNDEDDDIDEDDEDDDENENDDQMSYNQDIGEGIIEWNHPPEDEELFKLLESYEKRSWYSGILWPLMITIFVTLVVFWLVAAFMYVSKRRRSGPVIRPPMILRQGFSDNKNCGLVYKPLQEEIPTPHMPKRGSFYSSSTFHYDKIVPESV